MTKGTGKTALITGGSNGIGYQLALICAKNGIDLVLVARDANKLEEIKKDVEAKYKVKVSVFAMDLSLPEKAKELYNQTRLQNLVVDYLINNAGYGDYKKVVKADPDVYSNMIQLNITTLTELTILFAKDMVGRQSGRILNVASTAAYQPVPNLAVYAATKSYVVSFTEALHAELKGTGVTATVLSPGVTATGFVDRAAMNNSATAKGKQAEPANVAKAGYEAMLKGKLYIIPGFMNKLLTLGGKLMPSRRLVLAVSSLISKEM